MSHHEVNKKVDIPNKLCNLFIKYIKKGGHKNFKNLKMEHRIEVVVNH